MQRTTRKILAELSRPIPRSLNWRHSKLIYAVLTPQRVTVMTGCRSYLIQPRFFDSALWDYSTAPEGVLYGRYVDQRLP
jgi:hypothetical protein